MFNKKHNDILVHELASRSLGLVIVETGFLVLIALTALVGNSCVLYVFYKTPTFRKVANYYLIVLAMSDVTMSLTEIPLTIAVAVTGKDVLGRDVGQVFAIFGIALIYGSFLTTVLIAVNRFFCVVKPKLYKKYFKPKRAMVMIVVTWIISLCAVLVPFLDGTVVFEFYPGRLMYYPAFTDRTMEIALGVTSETGFMVFPALVAFCYWKIYRTVKGHNANVSTTLNAGPHGPAKPSREEINVTMTVLPLACGCILCYFTTSTLIHIDIYTNLPRSVDMCMLYVLFLNSAINPFIFNISNKPFRKEFLKLIFGYGSVRFLVASKVANSSSLRGRNLSTQHNSDINLLELTSEHGKYGIDNGKLGVN